MLELALVNYAMQTMVKKGFTPYLPPDLTHTDLLHGTGFQPRSDEHNQSYTVKTSPPLTLIGTSEIPMAGLFRNQILSISDIPKRLVAFSHCFRNEAGGLGQATKGIYRVHQFSKVELFAVTAPEDSERMFEELVDAQEELYKGLELHYRVIDVPADDLGHPAHRKIDMEAYMPGHAGGTYGEISSASNCTDYQSRRLNIRFKESQQSRTRFVHTLNATACAIPRLILSIMEQHQQADGTIRIPRALSPFLMGAERIPFIKTS